MGEVYCSKYITAILIGPHRTYSGDKNKAAVWPSELKRGNFGIYLADARAQAATE